MVERSTGGLGLLLGDPRLEVLVLPHLMPARWSGKGSQLPSLGVGTLTAFKAHRGDDGGDDAMVSEDVLLLGLVPVLDW